MHASRRIGISSAFENNPLAEPEAQAKENRRRFVAVSFAFASVSEVDP